jgi:hypothetical protein
MSEQALDLRRSLQIVRRHKVIVGIFVALGILAGAGNTALKPPLLVSSALVALPPTTHDTATQVVIASSDRVLENALRSVAPAMSLPTMRSRVHVKSLTPNLLSISGQGKTAAQAEGIANAVAASYVAYVRTANSAAGTVQAQRVGAATKPAGGSLLFHLLIAGGIGAVLGALIGAIFALAIGRTDRRLRERDEIADAIGVPVLASIPVGHPSDAVGWARLLEGYEPRAVHAWGLRKALHHLALTDFRGGRGRSLAVISLSSDPGALAIGPQLAAFAASLGIPTTLVIGRQQDANATATLSAACSVTSAVLSGRSSLLRVTVGDHYDADQQPDALVVAVAVVDGRTPRVADTMRMTATVLAVSAGAATADQLARVAVSAETDDRQIAGILVADPDSADHTTGRVPQLAPPRHRRMPTRLTGITTETRR